MMAVSSSEVWEYDKTHPEGLDTLTGDNTKPVHSDIPVERERSLSMTRHKYGNCEPLTTVCPSDAGKDPKTVIERRRSSVSGKRLSGTARKATGSFGGLGDHKPLGGLTHEEKHSVLSGSSNPFN